MANDLGRPRGSPDSSSAHARPRRCRRESGRPRGRGSGPRPPRRLAACSVSPTTAREGSVEEAPGQPQGPSADALPPPRPRTAPLHTRPAGREEHVAEGLGQRWVVVALTRRAGDGEPALAARFPHRTDRGRTRRGRAMRLPAVRRQVRVGHAVDQLGRLFVNACASGTGRVQRERKGIDAAITMIRLSSSARPSSSERRAQAHPLVLAVRNRRPRVRTSALPRRPTPGRRAPRAPRSGARARRGGGRAAARHLHTRRRSPPAYRGAGV